MHNKDTESKIYIIGAGISGLIAATNLEKMGYKPIVLEQQHAVGGRVRSEDVDGYRLDRGFQVLLEAYPKAIEYLDYDTLQLQALRPGALLYKEGKCSALGDPIRDSQFFLSTLMSSAGSLRDKWKIYLLNKKLSRLTMDQIFDEPETSTRDYLKSEGFSDRIIHQFFRPFFSGIFLEPNLETSSRMFKYIYKMFGEGMAMIPREGIQAIPNQLASKLIQTTFRFNTKVAKISGSQIHLENKEVLDADFIIVATDPSPLMDKLSSALTWKTCDSLYFTVSKKSIDSPIIGLSTEPDSFVNNIFYTTSINHTSKGEEEVLSVTVVKNHSFDLVNLVKQVEDELSHIFGIHKASFLQHYAIPCALPDLSDVKYETSTKSCLVADRAALAGDHLLNGSLNAAMISGENAAKAAQQFLSSTTFAVN